MKGGLFLDVIVAERAPILQLLPRENQTLLIRGNPFLVLDLGLDVVDGVRGLHFQSDGLARQSFHKDLHPTAETQHQVEGRLLLNVVVAESAAILQLFPGKDEPLLVRGNSFLVLDLRLDIFNGIGSLDL